MSIRLVARSLSFSLAVSTSWAQMPIGTAFTYQGRLDNAGSPANGSYDLQFTLWNHATDTSPAALVAGPICADDVSVANGLFTSKLDFGEAALNGDARWLEIGVRADNTAGNCSTGLYEMLAPRQSMTPAPGALSLPGLWTQQNSVSPNLIGGYGGNVIAPGVNGATICGGGAAGLENTVAGNFAAIGGGAGNVALAVCSVTQGCNNVVTNAADYGTISGGGPTNPNDVANTRNEVNSPFGTIGGGGNNFVGSLPVEGQASFGTVAGGAGNIVVADHATVGGGNTNAASGRYSVVAGGQGNSAEGQWSSVGGGIGNHATAQGSTVPGGTENVAGGSFSLAAGFRAKANHVGSFVWADSALADFTSTGLNQFLIRAAGGVGIGTNAPAAGTQLHVAGMVQMDGFKMAGGAVDKVLVSDDNGVGTWGKPPADDWSAGGNDIFNNNIGAVGIGTDAPTEKLDVAGTVQMTGFKMPTGAADGTVLMSDSAGIGTWQVPTGGGGPWQVLGDDIYYNAGRVGIGTNTPRRSVQVVGGVLARGGAPGANGVNNNGYAFYGGSGDEDSGMFSGADGLIQFYSNNLERMRINAAGNIGIGTTAPTARLHVVGNICATGAIGACSDGRFKKNVCGLNHALAAVTQLRGVNFDWKHDQFQDHQFAEGRQLGFIAQEVEQILPQIVSKGSDGYLAVDYGRLTPVIVEAIKEMRAEKDAQVAELRAQNANLQARLERLETVVAGMLRQD